MQACLPSSNKAVFDYRFSAAKHILHVTIGITVFMAVTVYESVLLQALMVSKGA